MNVSVYFTNAITTEGKTGKIVSYLSKQFRVT